MQEPMHPHILTTSKACSLYRREVSFQLSKEKHKDIQDGKRKPLNVNSYDEYQTMLDHVFEPFRVELFHACTFTICIGTLCQLRPPAGR